MSPNYTVRRKKDTLMNIQDIVVGGMLFVTGGVFFARMRKRGDKAKWKFIAAYLVMLSGAMTAVWDIFIRPQS